MEKVLKKELQKKSLIPKAEEQRSQAKLEQRRNDVQRRKDLKEMMGMFPEFAYEGATAYPVRTSNKV